ncbi:hypothetical protein [uncultured Agrococcus sp.]|nr:hypothetical protein [uncultured Agrococcus sp.]
MRRARSACHALTLAIALAACGETAVPDDAEPSNVEIGHPFDV